MFHAEVGRGTASTGLSRACPGPEKPLCLGRPVGREAALSEAVPSPQGLQGECVGSTLYLRNLCHMSAAILVTVAPLTSE